MDQPNDQASSTRAIRRLTFAVWALVLASLLNAGVVLLTSFLPSVLAHRMTDALPTTAFTLDPPFTDQFAGFHQWPLEKQIQSASVIAITTYREEDGKLKSVMSEILKQQPGVAFHYKIGDEYAHGNRYLEDNTFYGDGAVVFFTGSPAMNRYSASYANGRVGGMGDIPLQGLKELIEKQK